MMVIEAKLLAQSRAARCQRIDPIGLGAARGFDSGAPVLEIVFQPMGDLAVCGPGLSPEHPKGEAARQKALERTDA